MTYLHLPEHALEALNDGRSVTLTDSSLGRTDYNGAVTLVPPGSNVNADNPWKVRLEGDR